MVALTTPICDFGRKAEPFSLPSADGKTFSLEDCKGENGLLVMFICNHCPYVKGILPHLVEKAKALQELGIGVVAINSNDPHEYPEDAPVHMLTLSENMNFSFPYLVDSTQNVARAYDAVCTPDFFGFNKDLELQYRGRFGDDHQELFNAMQQIAQTGKGPEDQKPSIGCSIKWKSS